ncbi:hypothetical protein ANCCAN_02775 [Ancylostoma caninum]|uniref:Uncharacterized protein n=1 Tax=Ancylostoma caninum TaxID=29170 RepID=A0A368H5G4_ANCCA|nr:hypothetical protein ANCCAN_02775 [Ancylostoma caninum]
MRSSFNSFTSSGKTPSVYGSPQLTRTVSVSAAPSSRYESSSSPPDSSIRDSASLSRDYSPRDPVASTSRFSRKIPEDRKTSETNLSSRITRNDETNSLLERYGVRKFSITESPTQSFLKQRRQQQSDSDGGFNSTRRKSDGATLEAAVSGDGFSAFRAHERKETPKQVSREIQDITQNEYINRLLAAHNRVDDLLRSRGLSAEDESKYLRAWEEIPIIREERYRRLRTISNSSDSGLSTDEDSDRSNSENARQEQTNCEEEFSKQEPLDVCTAIVAASSSNLQSSLFCQASNSRSANASFSFGKKPSFRPVSTPIVSNLHGNEFANFACATPAYALQTTCHALKRRHQSCIVRKTITIARKGQNVNASFTVPSSKVLSTSVTKHSGEKKRCRREVSQRQRLPSKRAVTTEEGKPIRIIEQQRTVLASLKRKPNSSIPATAEISIQHCSFYQVSTRTKESSPEKNVRMNLRLTERAPNKCAAVIALPTSPRSQFACLTVTSRKKEVLRRSNTMQSATEQKFVGKLDRSVTVEIAKEVKQQRKVNRLVIPEFFLQSYQETKKEVEGPAIPAEKEAEKAKNKFTVEQRKCPSLKRSNAIRRRSPPNKNIVRNILGENDCSHSSGQSTFSSLCKGGKAQIEMSTHFRKSVLVPPISSLNLPGSLDRTATSRGAYTLYESKIAELSKTDRVLVEQFRRTQSIPRPKALQRRASSPPQPQQLLVTAVDKLPVPEQAQFVRFPTPERQPPQTHRHSPPPCLKRVYRSVKQFSKRDQLLECPSLKKVDHDHAVKKKLKIRRPKRWTPHWRRKW